MSYLHRDHPHRSAQEAWRRREARRRLYLRRRIGALIILLALAVGLVYGMRALGAWWQDRTATESSQTGDQPATTAPLPFTPAFYLNGTDTDGDGQPERIAVSQATGGTRTLALVAGPSGKEQVLGLTMSLPDFPLSMEDLAREQRVLVWSGERPKTGEVSTVLVGGAKARLAAGGEPDRKAWRLDQTEGFVRIDYYALIAPVTPPEPTVILVDKGLNVIWFYENGQLAQTSRVATGKHLDGPPITAATQRINYLTPIGRFPISLRQPGMPYYKENIPALDPRNPLGTRWLGFDAFEGDKGNVWAIHGTNDPSRLGQWVSEGCIEMRNEELEQLYTRVKIGTPIIIQNSLSQ